MLKQGKISKIDINLEIKSEIIEYKINDGKINFKNKVKINDKKNNLLFIQIKLIMI